MAIEDGLDIAPGRNQGEAVIFEESSFDPVSFSRHLVDMQLQNRARQRMADHQRHQEMNKFLSENEPSAKWDTDNINYFNQKFQDLRDKGSKLLAEGKGYLTTQQQYDIQKGWDTLKQEAEISNQQKELYEKALTESDKVDGKQRPVYDASSKEGVLIWGDPKRFGEKKIINSEGQPVTVEQELARYGGDVFKFRAANKNLLQLESNWDFTDRTGDILSEGRVKPNSVIELANIGGRRGTQQVENYTDDQIRQMGATLYGESPAKFKSQVDQYVLNNMSKNDYQKFATQALLKNGLIDQNGNEMPGIANLSPEEKQERVEQALSTEGYKLWFRKLHPTQKKGFNEFNKNDGSGKSFDDRYTVAAVHVPKTGGDYRDFNKKYGTNYTAEEFNAMKLAGDEGGYVAIEPKSGKADNESLQLTINGRQVRPIGYTVQNDKVLMTVSEGVPVEEGKDSFGRPIIKYKYKISRGIPVDADVAGNVAAHYGFTSFDGFKNMLNNQISKLGPAKSSAPENKWGKYKRK